MVSLLMHKLYFFLNINFIITIMIDVYTMTIVPGLRYITKELLDMYVHVSCMPHSFNITLSK